MVQYSFTSTETRRLVRTDPKRFTMNGNYIAWLFSKTFFLKAPQNVDPGGLVSRRCRRESVEPAGDDFGPVTEWLPLPLPLPPRH